MCADLGSIAGRQKGVQGRRGAGHHFGIRLASKMPASMAQESAPDMAVNWQLSPPLPPSPGAEASLSLLRRATRERTGPESARPMRRGGGRRMMSGRETERNEGEMES